MQTRSLDEVTQVANRPYTRLPGGRSVQHDSAAGPAESGEV